MIRSFAKSFVRALLVGMGLSAALPTLADYPDRPVRLIVPFPAGGTADALARAIANPLSRSLQQPVIVDNRPGADGLIAGEAVARAAPDGHTLLLGTSTGMSYAPNARRTLPYEPLASFSPIGRISYVSVFLYASAETPVRSIEQLISTARAQPRVVNYGSTSASSILVATVFAQAAGIELTHVPYQGDAPMLLDLLAGRIQIGFTAAGVAMAHAKEGRLRVLATADPSRSPLAPDAPTFREAGIEMAPLVSWSGLLGPAGMAGETVERLSRELRAVLARPEVREQFDRSGLQTSPSTPAEFDAFLRQQRGIWRAAMESAGIRPQ